MNSPTSPTAPASRYMAVMLVSNMARSITFYTQALGLVEHDCFQQRWCELWCDERLLALWTGQGADAALLPSGCAPGPGGTFVAFKVSNLEASATAVHQYGGTIEGTAEVTAHGQMLLVRDPDGNPLLLHHPHRALPGW